MQRVYDQLLAVRGGEAGGAELHEPGLRLRLLRSLARLLGRSTQALRQRLPSLPHSQRRRGALREVGRPLPKLSSQSRVHHPAWLLHAPALCLHMRGVHGNFCAHACHPCCILIAGECCDQQFLS